MARKRASSIEAKTARLAELEPMVSEWRLLKNEIDYDAAQKASSALVGRYFVASNSYGMHGRHRWNRYIRVDAGKYGTLYTTVIEDDLRAGERPKSSGQVRVVEYRERAFDIAQRFERGELREITRTEFQRAARKIVDHLAERLRA
jgi:hypothetical protein